jgi:hypothetical protein
MARDKVMPLPVREKLTKDQVRAMFPEVTAFADAMRKEFGDGVRLVYAEENGRCIGTKSVSDPERTVKVSEMCLDSSYFSDATERSKHHGKK